MHLLHLKAALNNFGLSKQRSPEHSVVKYNSRNDLALLGDVLRHVHAQVVRTRKTGQSGREGQERVGDKLAVFTQRYTDCSEATTGLPRIYNFLSSQTMSFSMDLLMVNFVSVLSKYVCLFVFYVILE